MGPIPSLQGQGITVGGAHLGLNLNNGAWGPTLSRAFLVARVSVQVTLLANDSFPTLSSAGSHVQEVETGEVTLSSSGG